MPRLLRRDESSRVLGSLTRARLTLVTPVNHEADIVEQLRLLSARLNEDCRYVVVKNKAHSEHFRIYVFARDDPLLLVASAGQAAPDQERNHPFRIVTDRAQGCVTAVLWSGTVFALD